MLFCTSKASNYNGVRDCSLARTRFALHSTTRCCARNQTWKDWCIGVRQCKTSKNEKNKECSRGWLFRDLLLCGGRILSAKESDFLFGLSLRPRCCRTTKLLHNKLLLPLGTNLSTLLHTLYHMLKEIQYSVGRSNSSYFRKVLFILEWLNPCSVLEAQVLLLVQERVRKQEIHLSVVRCSFGICAEVGFTRTHATKLLELYFPFLTKIDVRKTNDLTPK